MPGRAVTHLPLGLIVEFDGKRNQRVRQQSRQWKAAVHGRNDHTLRYATSTVGGRAAFFGLAVNSGAPSKFLRLDRRDLILEVVDSEVFLLEGEALMNIQRVGVVGAGTMGNGIAHVFARSGYRVVLCDVEQRFLDRGVETIGKNLDREVAKNKILAEDKVATLERIEPVVERAKLAGCDFVVEAATEKFDVKTEIFRDLDRLCQPEIILASNTSSISITKLAALTKRPDKVIGMHFFNPVPVMKLVEVIRGLATSNETFQTVRDLALKLEKTPVEVNDAPGFVSNRVLMPLLNEAMYAVMEGRGHAGGGGRSFQAGDGPSDGSADVGGFHRPRRLPRHHSRAARWLGRSQVPAVPAADQDGGRGLAGEEEWAGVL